MLSMLYNINTKNLTSSERKEEDISQMNDKNPTASSSKDLALALLFMCFWSSYLLLCCNLGNEDTIIH